ncbi:MAG TPA: cyanophycin synthetase, partial [Burkholderiales bacterium]
VAAGLATFEGVRRRMDVKGEAAGVLVLDDFAHHPTAIAETLRAVRQRYPGRRVWAVLEPRSWSLRRNVFQDRLAACFDDADEVVLAEVYGAEQLPQEVRLDPERLVRDLAGRGRPSRFLWQLRGALQRIEDGAVARGLDADAVVRHLEVPLAAHRPRADAHARRLGGAVPQRVADQRAQHLRELLRVGAQFRHRADRQLDLGKLAAQLRCEPLDLHAPRRAQPQARARQVEQGAGPAHQASDARRASASRSKPAIRW